MLRNRTAYFPGVTAASLIAAFALLALSHTATAQPSAQPPARDNIAHFTLKSEVLGEDRVIVVRTPAGYDRNDLRYPVLYMTDGGAHIDHTSATVGFLARNNRIPDMIVVGINNTDRNRDLSPTRVERLPGNPNVRFPTSGGADKFLKFIETELIPHIDKQYRTKPYRGLAGHSLGGLFTIHAMLSKPDLFASYIAVSPALNWDNFILVDRAKEFFKSRTELNRTLFMTLGNEPGDLGDSYDLFRNVLATQQVKGFSWETVRMDDEDHGSVVLRSHYLGLRKAFEGWQYPRDPNTGDISGGLLEVEDHFKKLSERLGITQLAPEGLMNQLGYKIMGDGDLDGAISAFKLNVERYPRSANVYDSLAEALERSGKLELARPNYEKAVALGKENADPNLQVYQTNLDRVAGLLSKSSATTATEKK